MPKSIDVPGQGIVEFPDDMSDEQIVKAIQANQSPITKTPTTAIGSLLTGAGQGLTFGWGDEAAAALAATVKAPFKDRTWKQLYNEQLAIERANLSAAKQENPGLEFAGELGGGVALGGGLASRGVSLLKGAKTVPAAIGRGAVEGGLYGGLYGSGQAEEGKRLEGGAVGAGVGALAGGALGGVAAKVGQGKLKIPEIEDLRTQANAAYKAADNAGIIVKPGSYGTMVKNLKTKLIKEGLDPTLHPDTFAAVGRLEQATKEGLPLSLSGIETLRKVSKDAAGAIKPSDRRLAYQLTSELDNFLGSLKDTDIVAGNHKVGVEALRTARSLWTRMSKAESIETLFERAKNRAGQFSGSGYENALRTEFRALVQNPKRLRQFNKTEQGLLKRVARGGPVENIFRYFGKWSASGPVSGALGAGAGYAVGGPVGAVAVPVAGGISRKLAEQMTMNNAMLAQRAALLGGPAPALPGLLGQSLLAPSTPLLLRSMENQ